MESSPNAKMKRRDTLCPGKDFSRLSLASNVSMLPRWRSANAHKTQQKDEYDNYTVLPTDERRITFSRGSLAQGDCVSGNLLAECAGERDETLEAYICDITEDLLEDIGSEVPHHPHLDYTAAHVSEKSPGVSDDVDALKEQLVRLQGLLREQFMELSLRDKSIAQLNSTLDHTLLSQVQSEGQLKTELEDARLQMENYKELLQKANLELTEYKKMERKLKSERRQSNMKCFELEKMMDYHDKELEELKTYTSTERQFLEDENCMLRQKLSEYVSSVSDFHYDGDRLCAQSSERCDCPTLKADVLKKEAELRETQDAKTSECSKLSGRVQQLEDELMSKTSECSKLSGRVQQLEDERAELRNTIISARTENGKLSEESNKLRRRLEEETAFLKHCVDESDGELDLKTRECITLRDTVRRLECQFSEYKHSIISALTEKDELPQELNDVTKSSQETEFLKQLLHKTEDEVLSKTAECSKLTDAVQQLQDELRECKSGMRAVQIDAADAELELKMQKLMAATEDTGLAETSVCENPSEEVQLMLRYCYSQKQLTERYRANLGKLELEHRKLVKKMTLVQQKKCKSCKIWKEKAAGYKLQIQHMDKHDYSRPLSTKEAKPSDNVDHAEALKDECENLHHLNHQFRSQQDGNQRKILKDRMQQLKTEHSEHTKKVASPATTTNVKKCTGARKRLQDRDDKNNECKTQ